MTRIVAEFSAAAEVRGADCAYAEDARLEIDAAERTVTLRVDDAAIAMNYAGALEIAEFIIRNVEAE